MILLAIRLRLHHQHLLRQTVRRIRLFGVAVPYLIFFKWHGRKFGIGADRRQRDKFFYAALVSFIQQLHAHHQVVIEKRSRMFAVGADAADGSRKMNHDVRFHLIVQAPHIANIAQIAICFARDKNFFATCPTKSLDEIPPDESRPAGDDDSFS